ncbi:hypothetical protein RJ641_025510 [Dillenia turbinata]|uniref:Uncharacterized protein n=1 Tax=Dillenia turbinata TaxID=194707 RepID=A0AAN8W110_9MAGN
MEEERDFPSLKQKLKSSLRIPCCFPPHHRDDSSVDLWPQLLRSTSWMRSRTHESPEFRDKDKRRHFIPRLGLGHRRRSVSTDFRYDPLSYALNFDDGSFDDSYPDDIPLRNSSSKLPPSPTPNSEKSPAKTRPASLEIDAYT